MKVRELVALLKQYDPEFDVHFAYAAPTQDEWITPMCTGVHPGHVTYSWLYNAPMLVHRLAEQSTAKEAVILFP